MNNRHDGWFVAGGVIMEGCFRGEREVARRVFVKIMLESGKISVAEAENNVLFCTRKIV